MNHPFFLAIVFTCRLAEAPGAAELSITRPEDAGFSFAKLKRVRDVMRRRVEQNQIPGGVVAISRQGKLVFLEAYGVQDEETRAPMTTDSIFRLYSMSKAITTAAAMMLVDEGKIALDDPVSKYLPEVANWMVNTGDGLIAPRHPMTIRDLMLHTEQ